MKSRRFQYAPRSNASKLHKAVLEWIREHYPHSKTYQEYPVRRVNPTWPNERAKYDIILKDLMICIEVHGEQHRRPILFGKSDDPFDTPEKRFKKQQEQDAAKKKAAEDMGWLYVVIWFDEKPEDVLPERLSQPYPEPALLPPLEVTKRPRRKKTKKYLRRQPTEEQKERAREYRRQQYRRWKEIKKERERRLKKES